MSYFPTKLNYSEQHSLSEDEEIRYQDVYLVSNKKKRPWSKIGEQIKTHELNLSSKPKSENKTKERKRKER
jgi:hypothetical protein